MSAAGTGVSESIESIQVGAGRLVAFCITEIFGIDSILDTLERLGCVASTSRRTPNGFQRSI
jgi:hypothetical protein